MESQRGKIGTFLKWLEPYFFSTKVPKYLWGEAVLTAAHLINRMPSRVLNLKTPLETFLKFFPTAPISDNLPLKIFGCTAFVHEHKQIGKLEPRAIKCVFVGYSPTQKGYKCFDPNSKWLLVTMDVTFFENKPFFESNHLQGGKSNEDSSYFFEDLILSENMLMSHSSRPFVPKENAPDNVNEPTPSMSEDVTESGATNQNSSNDSLEPKDNQELIQMSLHEHPYNETERKFGEVEGTWKGVIYGRKNHDKVVEDLIPQHNHESELRENQPTKTNKGKGKISPDFHDPILDVPIAQRNLLELAPSTPCLGSYHIQIYPHLFLHLPLSCLV